MTGAAFLLLALAAAAACGDWLAVHHERKPLEYLCKPLTLVLLVGAALALHADHDAVRTWFVIALVLSLAGDVFLMLPGDLFVLGLGSFLLGHIAYIAGMHVIGTDAKPLLLGAGLVLALLGLVGRTILRAVRGGPDAAMAGPVMAYMAVISVMVAKAFGTGHPLVIIGASLFYLSDSLIAWNRFCRPIRHGSVAVMVTYHLAQAALVLSLA